MGAFTPLLLLVVVYMTMIRPQQKRVRDQRSFQTSLAVDDEVMTSAGMFGRIVSLDGDLARLEIADGVVVKVVRQALVRKADDAMAGPAFELVPGDKPPDDEPGDDEPATDAPDLRPELSAQVPDDLSSLDDAPEAPAEPAGPDDTTHADDGDGSDKP